MNDARALAFGREMRAAFELAPDAAFLNHGSFGACPKVVLAEQARWRREMEAEPDAFFRRHVYPGDRPTTLRAAAGELAAFVNVPGGNVAFVENATIGVQAALRSMPLARGDRILITNHTYPAVRIMTEARCAETGASPLLVTIPLPTTAEAIAAAFEAALTPEVKLAILDHITSPTALVMPLERIIPPLRRFGARIVVDGAHAVGHVPLDLARLQSDWYVSNAHKWLFAPRGTALFHAADGVAPMTRPPVISHFTDRGFPQSFDWLGTRDYTAWLSVPAALRFAAQLDHAAVGAHQRRLLLAASELLAGLGIEPATPLELCAGMRSFVLPQRRDPAAEDARRLMHELWERDRVQVNANVFDRRLLLRVSANIYVDESDLVRLGEALRRYGWPGR